VIPILIVVPALASLLVVTFVLAYLAGQKVADKLAEFGSELKEIRELMICRPELLAMHRTYQDALKSLLHTYEQRFTTLEGMYDTGRARDKNCDATGAHSAADHQDTAGESSPAAAGRSARNL